MKKNIRNITIVFLVVLALLTFFSNTIMNYSLPEVSTVTVARGSVSKKVKTQGDTEISKDVEITVSGERVVKDIFFENGDSVKEGDVIMSFEKEENQELSEAEDSLEDMEYDYKKSQLREKTDYTEDEKEIESAREDLTAAQEAVEKAEKNKSKLSKAKKEAKKAEAAYEKKNEEVAELQAKVDEYSKIENYEGDVDVDKLVDKLSKAKKKLAELQSELDDANDKVTKLSEKKSVKSAEEDLKNAEKNLDSLVSKYDKQIESDRITEQENERADEKSLKDIEKQKSKIEKIKAESDFEEVRATASGIITGINAKKGDKLEPNTVVADIQKEDSGYEVTCSISKRDAKLIAKGDEAIIENIWDDNVKATVKSVKADPEDPNRKSIVKFLVKGNVKAGETLQFSVGKKSDKYETVVPNSAVKEDSKGKFLLVVNSKATPLGNRYMVKRVEVEVEASDDSNSAVRGDIEQHDNVVTNSSKPLDNNQQVRLAK